MNTAEQIIASILAVTLAIFLVLAIIAVVMVIGILKKVKIISERAEQITEAAQEMAETFRQSAPFTILRFLGNIADVFGSRKHKDKE